MRGIHLTLGQGGSSTVTPPQQQQVGSLPVGEAVYPVPGNAIYVATTGNDTTGNGTVGNPYATLAKADSVASTGATVVLRGGVYHQGNVGHTLTTLDTVGLTVQNYPGEAVWFDGSSVVTGWVIHSAGVWKKTGWTVDFPYDYNYSQGSTTNSSGFVNASYPAAHMPDQVFVDEVPLQQVDQLANVTTGFFYVDKAAATVYIGTDPTGHTVRMSDLSTAFIALAADITIRGIGFRKYGNPLSEQGPVRLHRARGTLENVVSEYNATTGIGLMGGADCVVRYVTAHHNGLMGIAGYQADRMLLEYSECSYNNLERFNAAPSSGGCKITRTQVATFRGNNMHHNVNSSGLWLDEVVYNFTIVSNDFTDNDQSGLNLEISELGVVADNLVVRNQTTQLLVHSTNHVTFWCNTVADNTFECVVFQQDNRNTWTGRTGVRDNRQPATWYDTVCTWWMDSFTFCNNVMGESRYTPFRVKQYNYTGTGWTNMPSKGWAAFGFTMDGNLWNRTNRDANHTPSKVVGAWSTGLPGSETSYNTVPLWQTGSTAQGLSADAFSKEVSGTGVLDAKYMLTPAAQAVTGTVGRPLPADIAALIGRPAGSSHIGCWR